MKYTVGCVPYANAIPLVAWFEKLGEKSPVRVRYDIPSRLPALLATGEADAILVSSVDALLMQGRRMAEGVCIGSHGPVKSVRLFSKVPPSDITSLALDDSSMTSNRLAQVVLRERFEIQPSTHPHTPDLTEMLDGHDACVLIGDIGMTSPSEGLHVLDLGEEWRRLTGKPFVWAAWVGQERLTPELALWLATAAGHYCVGRDLAAETLGYKASRLLMSKWFRELEDSTRDHIDSQRAKLLEIAKLKVGWQDDTLRDYFLNVMVYEMDDSVLNGLREFQRLLLKNGFDDCVHFPDIVSPATANLDAMREFGPISQTG